MSEAFAGMSNPQLPTFYCVKAGDSFASIALTECRDADYASAIAAANGYDSADNSPTPGQVLTIPNLVPSQNNLLTGIPFSALYSSIIGSLYPQLQTPQPPHHHHSWWEIALVVVVAVAAAWAGGIGAAALVGAMGMTGTTATLAIAAIAGAVSDIAAQAAGDLEGLQSGISWSEVLTSAVEAALLAKVPGANAAREGLNAEEVMNAVLYYGEIAVADQLVQIATGEQNGFDLKALMASMAAAAVTSAADTKISNAAASKSFNEAVDMLSSHLFDNMPLDMEDFAGEVLGTAAGTALTEAGDYLRSRAAIKAASDKAAPGQTTDAYKAPDSEARRTSTSQWSKMQNAQNAANESFMDDLKQEVDADFARAISISSSSASQKAAQPVESQTQVVAAQQAQAGVRASTMPFASNFMSTGLGQDFAASFKAQVLSIPNWGEAAFDNVKDSKVGKTFIGDMASAKDKTLRSWSDVKLSYARMNALGDSTNFFGQKVYGDAFASDLNSLVSNGARYGGGLLLTQGSNLLKVFDIVSATRAVANAPAGQAGWVALKEYGAIPAAILGAGAAGYFGSPIALVIGTGTSLVADPAVGVAAGIATDITAQVVGASIVSAGWMSIVDRIQQNAGSLEEEAEEWWSKGP